MARSPIQAAGGIVFRSGAEPLIAVVRLSKGDDWVLPKGKLNPGETFKAAAEREVWEETGFAVSVHEFLGKLKYSAGGRPKVVHFWRMEAAKKDRDPMDDVTDVEWLPMDVALERLSRNHERNFLADIGPLAAKARQRNGSQNSSVRAAKSGGTADNEKPNAKRGKTTKRTTSSQPVAETAGFVTTFRNWLRAIFSART